MIGIVILNYISWKETIKCVESIKQTYNDDYKIVIVDNCSPNESHNQLKFLYENEANIVVIQSRVNGGYSKGNNIGIDYCIKENIKYAIITNNDILFRKNAINELYKHIKQSENIVIAAPQILDNDEDIMSLPWIGQQSFWQYLQIKNPKNMQLQMEDSNKAQDLYMVSGCCFMINIPNFKKMGAFDEETFLYNEEGMYSVQAQQNNLKQHYVPSAKVIHNHGASTGVSNLFVDAEILKSGMYYWKKYEKISNNRIRFLYIFMVLRTSLKVLLHRTSGRNYFRFLSDTYKYFKYIINNEF